MRDRVDVQATAILDSPLGPIAVRASDMGVTAVEFLDDVGKGTLQEEDSAELVPARTHVADAIDQLNEYFAGRRQDFTVALDLRGTDFQRSAWEALRRIPFGSTVSYAEQASSMGRPTATRAVGGANGKNPVPVIVPCHRVIGADGSLTGFSAGIERKVWLLEHERRRL